MRKYYTPATDLDKLIATGKKKHAKLEAEHAALAQQRDLLLAAQSALSPDQLAIYLKTVLNPVLRKLAELETSLNFWRNEAEVLRWAEGIIKKNTIQDLRDQALPELDDGPAF